MNRRVGLTGPVTIEIGGKARKFHVLHGTAGLVPEETEIATLVVQYSEGNPEELPIQYGVHVRDWWMWKKTENPTVGPGNQMVWQGENEYSKSKNCRIRVFASTFENPRPEAQIERIIYKRARSAGSTTSFMLGMTLE